MSPEEQQIAIAKQLGWKQTDIGWCSPEGHEWQVMYGWNTYKDGTDIVPNYVEDLNAMHEAEKVLDPAGKDGAYEYWLRTICRIPERESAKGRYFYRATAAQRAEAFLRSLNLWKNDDAH